MKTRRFIASAAFVMTAMAAGTGVASAIPEVSYVPVDNPATTSINEAGTVQTNLTSGEMGTLAGALGPDNPTNPLSPISQSINAANAQNNDCYTINSSSVTNHAVQGYNNGTNGFCETVSAH